MASRKPMLVEIAESRDERYENAVAARWLILVVMAVWSVGFLIWHYTPHLSL